MSQIGTDRVIEIQFSDGSYRLFLEFYAGGNIVLTDNDLTILALLRNVSEGAEHEQYRLGLKYDLSLRQNFGGIPDLTKDRVREGLQKAVGKQQDGAVKPGRKIKKKAGDALRKALAVSITEYPPVLIDHALQVKGIDREVQPEQVLADDGLLDNLMGALQEAGNVVKEITSAETAKGYILAKRTHPEAQSEPQETREEGQDASRKGLMYDDFHPFKPVQLVKDDVVFLEYDGFNKAVDDFFSSIEGQRLESKLQEREDNAKRKLEQARQEQAKRIDGLQQVQELNVRKAQAIEANVDRVEEATAAVNGLIAQGMDWVDIARLIEQEQSRHNPVAETIKLPLKLYENTVTLLISEVDNVDEDEMADVTDSEPSDSEDEDRPSATARPARQEEKRLTIDVDLALSAWSNARQYYDQKRVAATKQERTAQASEKALKSTEQKVMADLKKGLKQEKQVLRPVRRQMWFEKFIYFVSSDGYLVLGGKDAQQNEMLYRRYLKKGDIYVHADLHGAASVIIKNNPATPDAPIPPSTLSQAGNLSVCTSSAWDSKAVMSAWWVNSDQVSKTAPTGEYLTTGGFMVRGKKNFLPPAQLLLGFAVMFHISEESKARHVKHRLRDTDAPVAETERSMDAMPTQEEDEQDDDDDFPDATKAVAEDDDDFPDATGEAHEDDDFPDAEEQTDNGEHSGDDADEVVERRANPLQMNGSEHKAQVPNAGNEGAEDEDDEVDEEEEVAKDYVDTEEAAAPPSDSDALVRDEPLADTNAPSGIRHLSARERRLQRKGLDSSQQTSESEDQPGGKSKNVSNSSSKPTQPARGKRGKAKKLATKYANQDEEDRELAMKLLGSRAADEKREADEAKASKTESAEAARARRRAQHEKTQREGLEAEEIRKLNLEEGVEALDEEESAALTQLDTLVGMPLPGDEILEAIPVCAPWASLGKYKYKAKLQPGAQKKGKATREILGNWIKAGSNPKIVDQKSEDKERIWPREAELIKGWKEAEIVGVIPVSKVRVMMSGGGGSGGGGDKTKGKGAKSGRGGKGSKKIR